ncbi:MAG TPA: PQQ-dependent sugar dehydrogenase [Longimicrobiales bacterium]|nr:PQQ-dependent sugar dehydrogenase [Longimicrobiales bacterium]
MIRRFGTPLAIALLWAGCSDATDTARTNAQEPNETAQDCEPLETRDKEAPNQEPAFPEQTRACGMTTDAAFTVDVVTTGLEHPWAVEPLPDGDFLVTERPGRMRIVSASGQMGQPIAGIPDVDARRQGGLLDVALSPDFESDRTIFWSYAEPRQGGNGTAVARGVLSEDRSRVEDVRVIFRAMPTYDGTHHFGSRLAFDPEGNLYITTGDRSDANMREHAQRLDGHMGKVLRIAPDGSVPQDNPFVGQDGAEPEIYTLGHRNIQAAAFDTQGRLWTIEHGTRGGDELNLLEPGGNYGWPEQAYGIEYSGDALPGDPNPGGFEQPVYYWDPVIAPSGAQWYTGDAFPEWQGNLFIGALRDTRLVRLRIEDGRVTGEEHLLRDRGQRIRDVRQGTDGALYMVTDQPDGELWRLRPEG